jgi:hypothetical protein
MNSLDVAVKEAIEIIVETRAIKKLLTSSRMRLAYRFHKGKLIKSSKYKAEIRYK